MRKIFIILPFLLILITTSCENSLSESKPGNKEQSAIPSLTPPGGQYEKDIDLTLSCKTRGATIYYTLDGSEPTGDSKIYSDMPISISGDGTSVTVKAISIADGMEKSDVAESAYKIDYPKISHPIFNPVPGTYDKNINVSIINEDPGVIIYYTNDGSEPGEKSKVYENPIAIKGDMNFEMLKAVAICDQKKSSKIVTGQYKIDFPITASPEFNHSNGIYNNEINIEITSDDAEAAIYYTTDGTEPDISSQKYIFPISLNQDEHIRIKAFALVSGKKPSPVVEGDFLFDRQKIAAPQISPSGGIYKDDVDAIIQCNNSEASIYYTTDGSEPSIYSNRYINDSVINIVGDGNDVIVKAIAVADNMEKSETASSEYKIRHIKTIKDQYYIFNKDHIQDIIRDKGNASLVEIDGSLLINIMHDKRMKDLDGLDVISSVKGDVNIENCDAVETLKGLSNLSYIGGNLIISNNRSMSELFDKEHSRLKYIQGNLVIKDNNNLLDLNGLESLAYVGGNVSIVGNESLEGLQGLSALTRVGKNFELNRNSSLGDLQGLESLNFIGEDLVIEFNSNLESINGINNNLKYIVGNLEINFNSSLQAIDGLINLFKVYGDLIIDNNEKLVSLIGLSNINYVGGNFSISNNNLIEDIDFNGQHLKSIGRDALVYNNRYLQTMTGLGGVVKIRGNLQIGNNKSLISIDGLRNLVEIEKNFLINNNAELEKIESMEGLSLIGGIFEVLSNDSLFEIKLNNLISIDGNIVIKYNSSLSSIQLPDNVKSLHSTLEINQNNSLITLKGLEGITSIDGDLIIYENEKLESLSGLKNLTSLNGNLDISKNLNIVSLEHLGNIHHVRGYITITENDELKFLWDPGSLSGPVEYLKIMNNNNLNQEIASSFADKIEVKGVKYIYGNKERL